jgi:hypothetical protein
MVPAALLRGLQLAVAVLLCSVTLHGPLWLAMGWTLAVASTFAPNRVAGWWLLLLLGGSQFVRLPSATDPSFYALLAGIPMLHLLGRVSRLISWRGRIELLALARPLKRYVTLQGVLQPVSFSVMRASADSRGTVIGLTLLAALILSGIAALLYARLRVARGRPAA